MAPQNVSLCELIAVGMHVKQLLVQVILIMKQKSAVRDRRTAVDGVREMAVGRNAVPRGQTAEVRKRSDRSCCWYSVVFSKWRPIRL